MPAINYNRCWLRCPASWTEPSVPKAEPADKPKREPAKWRPMTDLEIEAATQLGRCRLPPATSTKRLCRHMAAQAQADEPKITDKQAEYLWKFCWTYRRQIASAAVVKEAKQRREKAK